MLHLMFPEILSKKTTVYSKEQHKELPEIMGPFFSVAGWGIA
jgi:hypothetical protein